MTQIGLGYGSLIQQGMQSGAAAYRASQQLAMQRQAMEEQRVMDALRMQAIQDEMIQRHQRAQADIEQQDIDREFLSQYGALAAQADPEAEKLQNVFQPVVQPGTGALAQTAATGNPTRAAAVQQPTVPADPIIEWDRLARASPRVYNLIAGTVGNRAKAKEQIAAERARIKGIIDSGLSRFTGPPSEDGTEEYANLWQNALDRGDLTREDVRRFAPEQVGAIIDERNMRGRQSMIDYLTLRRGPDGLMAQDPMEAEQLGGFTDDHLRDMVRRTRIAEQEQAAKSANAAASQRAIADALEVANSPAATPKERATAQAILAQMDVPHAAWAGSQGQTDPARIRMQVERAKQARDQAEQEYAALNPDADNAAGRMAPPSDGEVELSKRASSGFWTSDGDWNRAKAKVAAWEKYQKSVADLDRVYAAAAGDPITSGADQPPALSQQATPQQSTATQPTGPGFAGTPRDFGEAYGAPDAPADAGAMVDQYLAENQAGPDGTVDVRSLVERMLDAQIDPEEIKKTLKAKGFQ